MKIDDETLLSAYIDGQLNPKELQVVERALNASPEIAQRVRALSAVRDLVSGLPRDTCADISRDVMLRIGTLPQSRSPFSRSLSWAIRARHSAVVAGMLTAAAAIVLTFSIPYLHGRRNHFKTPAALPKVLDQAIADSQTGHGTPSSDLPVGRVELDVKLARPSTAQRESPISDSRRLAADPSRAATHSVVEPSSPVDLELCRRLLDSPAERRLFLIADQTDGKTRQQVAKVVEHTSRLGYFKIDVSQGIIVAPRYPDQATVFTLFVDSKELDHLREQLKEVVVTPIEERVAEPGIVTQLADMIHVQRFSPGAPADVLTPREALAFRTKGGAVESGTQPTSSSPPAEKGLSISTPEQFRSAPVENSDEKILVLVWLCN